MTENLAGLFLDPILLNLPSISGGTLSHCWTPRSFLLFRLVFYVSWGLAASRVSSQHRSGLYVITAPPLGIRAMAGPREFSVCEFGRFPLTLEDFHLETANVQALGRLLSVSESGKVNEATKSPLRLKVEESELWDLQLFLSSKYSAWKGGDWENQVN